MIDALQYPWLICRCEDGYDIALPQTDPRTKQPVPMKTDPPNLESLSQRRPSVPVTYMRTASCCAQTTSTPDVDLFHQFITDMLANKIEADRLNFIRPDKAKLLAGEYIHLKDATMMRRTPVRSGNSSSFHHPSLAACATCMSIRRMP